MLKHSGQIWKALRHCRTWPRGYKSLTRARPYIVMVDVYLESHFHSLLLPLNFRSISSPDFSESFQELRARHEFKSSTGFNSNHLAGMSPFCFGNGLHGLCLGNSSLFCSSWNQTSPLKEGNYFKPLIQQWSTVLQYIARNGALGQSPFSPASPFVLTPQLLHKVRKSHHVQLQLSEVSTRGFLVRQSSQRILCSPICLWHS